MGTDGHVILILLYSGEMHLLCECRVLNVFT